MAKITQTSAIGGAGDMKFNPWFRTAKFDAHQAVFATVQHLRARQPYASMQHWHNFRLYAGFQQATITGGRTQQQTQPNVYDRYRLVINVARRCVDTVHSRVIQNKTKPMPLTIGGDSNEVKTAKMLDQLGQGMFYHANVYAKTQEIAKDAEIFGTGCGKTYEDWDGKPALERVFIDHVVVDEMDGLERRPKSIYIYKAVDRNELLENPKYKKYKDKIRQAALPTENGMIIIRDSIIDQVGFCEAWKLPSNPYAKDGRHVICLNNVTLVDEPWEKPRYPLVFMRWNERSLGFFGQGICEQVSGIHFELNALLAKNQEQMRLSGPKVFLERGANIVTQHINNEIWSIIEYTGTAPIFSVFDSVSPEAFAQVDRLDQKAFEEIGVSQLAAHGEKPAGLNSGKALLTFDDLETSNLSSFGGRYDDAHLEIYRHFVDIARESHMKPDHEGTTRAFVVRYPSKQRYGTFLQEVKWSDVNVENDEYSLQVFPTAFLPSSPAGKLQQVGDMIDRGMLQGDQATSLLDYPDLSRVTSLITAPIDDIDMMADAMLDDGKTFEPEVYSNNKLAISRMNSHYLRAKHQNYPDDRLDLLRTYIQSAWQKDMEADAQKAAAQAAASQPPGAPMEGAPALPQGVTAPPPPVAGAPGAGLPQ